jgi:hypothetical protein
MAQLSSPLNGFSLFIHLIVLIGFNVAALGKKIITKINGK